jgi:hypothetical protein
VPKAAWGHLIAGLAKKTDYDNFKSAVDRYRGKVGAAYEQTLHDILSVMHELQETKSKR